MTSKEVYEEIFADYVNTERHNQDCNDFNELDLFERMEDALEEFAPKSPLEFNDRISNLMYDAQQLGFFCGFREAFRHLMLTEVQV